MARAVPTADPLYVEAARPPHAPAVADRTFRAAVIHTLRVPRAEGADDGALKAVAETARGFFRCLDAAKAPNLTDAGLRAVAMASPNLQELTIDQCEGIKGAGLAAVADCCPRLRSISLAGCRWLGGWVLARLGNGCTMLETLNLDFHSRMTDDDLRGCVRHSSSLTDVSLRHCTGLSDPGVLAVARSGTRLRRLVLDRKEMPYRITDVACLALAQHCSSLTDLSLHNCEKITDSGVSWVAGACHSMTSLDLRGCTKLSDMGMRAIAEGFPLLQRLRVTGCKRVGDVGIRHVATGCRELSELDAGGLFLLSDGQPRDFGQEGLQALADASPPLAALNLGGCTQIGDRVARRLPGAFPGLRTLVLAGCGQLTAPGLRDCFAGFASLTSVNLRTCPHSVSDGVLAAIAAASGRHLTSLNVSGCHDITDRGTSSIARRCRQLQTLDVSGCRRLTDLCMFALADADLFPGLKTISLRKCEGVTETGVSWLAMRCTTITRLDLFGCSVSRVGLRAMAPAFPHAIVKETTEYFGFAPAPRGEEYREIAVYGRTWSAAARIQGLYRAKVARRRTARLRRERLEAWVATRLQAWWRGRRARARAYVLRMLKARETSAVTAIQAAVRGWRARRDAAGIRHSLVLQRRHDLVSKMQALWRGRTSRNLLAAMRGERMRTLVRREEAARLLQRVYRGFRSREEFSVFKAAARVLQVKHDVAAVQIQRVFKGWLTRRTTSEKRRQQTTDSQRQFRAARLIQTRIRIVLAKRTRARIKEEREILNAAATAVQAAWRARKGQLHVQQLRQVLRLKQMETAALLVQRAWRGKQGRLSAFLLRRARSQQGMDMEAAASKMQRLWRGHKGRKHASRLAQLLELDVFKQRNLFQWAATQVQRRWRGVLGRRRANAVRQERARRWKQLWDERVGRPFWYDKLTGEIRWRKPQEALDLETRPLCSNCEHVEATAECKDCGEFYCETCFGSVHSGGKRRHHVFRSLYDYYGRRIDYGEGEWPALWPTEIRQDEFAGWMPISQRPLGAQTAIGDPVAAAFHAGASPGAAATLRAVTVLGATQVVQGSAGVGPAVGGRAIPAASHITELGPESGGEVRTAAGKAEAFVTGGGSQGKARREAANDGWTKIVDPATGGESYFDVKTGVLTADRPVFFVTPRSNDPDAVAAAVERQIDEDGLPVWQAPATDFPVPPGPGKALPTPGPGGWLKYSAPPEQPGGPASVYYFNVATHESRWDRPVGFFTPRIPPDGTRPAEIGPPGTGWAKYVDDASGGEYYHNTLSGESSWERPAGFSTPRPGDGQAPLETVHGWTWAKYWSDEHQAEYWLDHATGESSWERPAGWGTPRVGDGYGVTPADAATTIAAAAEVGGWETGGAAVIGELGHDPHGGYYDHSGASAAGYPATGHYYGDGGSAAAAEGTHLQAYNYATDAGLDGAGYDVAAAYSEPPSPGSMLEQWQQH